MTSSRFVLASLAILLATGCAAPAGNDAADEATGEAQEAQNTHNSLLPQALFQSTIAANPFALATLASSGLQSAMNDPFMRQQLHGDPGGAMMSYLVSCALGPGQTITASDPFDGTAYAWSGDVGLCPSWQSGAPSDACRQAVSGCILARVNAVGVRVPVSLRGAGLPLRTAMAPDTFRRDGSHVASFDACPTRSFGPQRNCGWWPVNVGLCTPGTTITVGAGADASNCAGTLGKSTQDTMLRVCAGLTGCDAAVLPWSGLPRSNDDACGRTAPSVQFQCPASGAYSVMGAAYDSSVKVLSMDFTVASNAPSFPAPEYLVYGYVEGAFYGDLFDAGAVDPLAVRFVDTDGNVAAAYSPTLGVRGPLPQVTLYHNGYACYSAQISDGLANLQQRMCTSGACVMNIAGACGQQAPGRTGPINQCDGVNAAGTGEYDRCHGEAALPRFDWPITTYLHDPCDTVTAIGGTPPTSCQINPNFAPLF
jgi:hypothetical protein